MRRPISAVVSHCGPLKHANRHGYPDAQRLDHPDIADGMPHAFKGMYTVVEVTEYQLARLMTLERPRWRGPLSCSPLHPREAADADRHLLPLATWHGPSDDISTFAFGPSMERCRPHGTSY